MTARLEKNGTYTSQFWYEDIYGKRRHKCKRGFATEEEADAFEEGFLRKARGSMEMKLADFVDVYLEDVKVELREYTLKNRLYIINDKIVPVLGSKRMKDIETIDIIRWQNKLLAQRRPNGEPYSQTYLRTINNALGTIFSHAAAYYHLSPNPMVKAPSIGSKKTREIKFWTKDQYLRFSEELDVEDILFYAFEVLYWLGLRVGELLALVPEDIDFKSSKLHVGHSFQRLNGRDVITDPKTEKSIRDVVMPLFVRDELYRLVYMILNVNPGERIFASIDKGMLKAEIERICEKIEDIPVIRVHDLRHSHISLLINEGYNALEIGDRAGQESMEITLQYGHMFPESDDEMADSLQEYKEGRHDM